MSEVLPDYSRVVVLVCNLISGVSLWALLSSITINFIVAKRTTQVKKEKRSWVETGTMFLFFCVMFALTVWYRRMGFVERVDYMIQTVFAVIGTLVIIASTAVNIIGRMRLKGNWGNQVRIYEDHTLVTSGIYKYVRNPLYTSTITMMYGFAILTLNPLVVVLVTAIFIPMMVYRSKQEEAALEEAFGEQYTEYKNRVGRLFPKW